MTGASDKKLAGQQGSARVARQTAAWPAPTAGFRRRAWLVFQRALDPLAPPKRLPTASPPRRRQPPDG